MKTKECCISHMLSSSSISGSSTIPIAIVTPRNVRISSLRIGFQLVSSSRTWSWYRLLSTIICSKILSQKNSWNASMGDLIADAFLFTAVNSQNGFSSLGFSKGFYSSHQSIGTLVYTVFIICVSSSGIKTI